jgi:hypothetical protein
MEYPMIESQTPAVQLACLAKCRIAEKALQRFAEREDTLTAAQAVPIDAALAALSAALTAAGVSGLPATSAIVANGATVAMKNSAGSKSVNGTASVAASAVTGVALPATAAIVDSTVVPVIQNSAGTAVAGVNTRTVAAGLETNVRTAATVGFVVNAVKQSGWTVTGTGTFFTPTVANGVCTGGVLSAS